MMYNPPWTLPLIAPFALLEYHWARLLWLVLSAAALFFSCNTIWTIYGGPRDRRPLAWLVAGLFFPTISVLRMGQIGAFLLLGLILFLLAVQTRRDFWAGVALFLPSLKPHLFAPLVVILLLWIVQMRRWRILLGGGVALCLALAIALFFDPLVFAQYRMLMRDEPPTIWYTPSIGNFLRLAFGWQHHWLQFVPTALGAAWAVWYWLRCQNVGFTRSARTTMARREEWDWRERLPLVLLVGVVVASYGAWIFDLVVLLLPILAVTVPLIASRWRWWSLGIHVLLSAGSALLLEGGADPMWLVWAAPTLLGLYLLLHRHLASMRNDRSATCGTLQSSFSSPKAPFSC
jgi:hypothetical protein